MKQLTNGLVPEDEADIYLTVIGQTLDRLYGMVCAPELQWQAQDLVKDLPIKKEDWQDLKVVLRIVRAVESRLLELGCEVNGELIEAVRMVRQAFPGQHQLVGLAGHGDRRR